MAKDRIAIAANTDRITIQGYSVGPTVHGLAVFLVSDLAHRTVHSLGSAPATRCYVGGKADKLDAGLKATTPTMTTLRLLTVHDLAPYTVGELDEL